MNYYIEMIKEFVQGELTKESGKLLDDGEYIYSCGLLFQKLMTKEKKQVVSKTRTILQDISTFSLFRIEILALLDEYYSAIKHPTKKDRCLIHMVREYEPQGIEIDSTLKEVLEEALNADIKKNPYERQERYSKKVGIISKTYKLNEQVVNDFADACKKRGASLGPTLTKLMQKFIDDEISLD